MSERENNVLDAALYRLRRVGKNAGAFVLGVASGLGGYEPTDDYVKRIISDGIRDKKDEDGVVGNLKNKPDEEYGTDLWAENQIKSGYL